MRGGWSGGTGTSGGNYSSNPCLTMHQPWASLLIYGIKRIEGRSWPAPLRGRLWIHAAGKVPEQETIKAMEDFYKEIYSLNGITDIKFPQHYPVSRLLGCVEIVGCLKRVVGKLLNFFIGLLQVRVEALTDFCWLCEQPQKLLVPFEMRGSQGVYNLERKMYESAVRGLVPIEGPMPVKFPLPNPTNPFSLRPGSIGCSRSEVERSSRLIAAIDSARAAATQYTKKDHNQASNSLANSSSTKRYEWRIIKSLEKKTQISQGDINMQQGSHSNEERPTSNESKLDIDIKSEGE
ncbi:Activating signal cointegrator 1 [Linum grandiflorum]